MSDALKAWLRARLGVIMDLTPEVFCRHTRDGRLLAQILHSYDIISSSQLSTIPHTRDPALSRVNLRTLRIWLKLINVTLSDGCIEEISNGKGAAALQLFYKVYLSLEGKDRLHFIALQKEREKFTPTSDRFDVTKVSEDPPPYQPPEHPLTKSLIEATDTILWHRDKFWRIVEACRRERQRFEVAMKYPAVEPVEYFVQEVPSDDKQEESERLDEFARRHQVRKTKERYKVVECCPSKKFLDVPFVEDRRAAAEYVDFFKKRSRRAVEPQKSKLKAQTMMMRDAWEKLLRKQDKSFDEALGKRVLDQSQYEKRMMSRLCEVRDLRNRIVENRRIIDAMLLRARENELRLQQDHRQELTLREIENVEMENRRMLELRQRIHEEKARGRREKYRGLCAEIARDLADIAVKTADYRRANDNYIPRPIWNEWRTLFLKNQPIFEIVNYLDETEAEDEEEIENRDKVEGKAHGRSKIRIKDGKEEGNEEESKTKKDVKNKGRVRSEEERRLIRLELERRAVLADADFENYRDLASPWDEFVSRRREEEDDDVPRLGRIVLGYVVHRLLEVPYPYAAEVATCPVPRVRIATIVLGITNPALHEQLRELLKKSGVYLLRMEDAINHSLERYKREMADVEYIDLNIVSATARDAKRSEAMSKMDNLEDRRSKKLERMKMAALRQSAAEEKQTQTPRQIPYDDMDPILSDAACIGKWTYEFLTLGQPISNELNTRIIIEYLKGIGDVEGWVLINYPSTYEQMAMLEKALTGHEVPSDRKIIDFADVNVEDVDPPSPRIVFESDEVDTFAICRQSRLLPNPISRANDHRDISTTFMTMYVKATPKSKSLDNQDPTCMPLPDDATSIDEYYANQNVAYGFYYNVLDTPTIKQLATFITDNRMFDERLSLDFFENIPQMHHVRQESPTDSKTAVIKRWVLKSEWKNLQRGPNKNFDGTESHDLQPEMRVQSASSRARPGEDGWQWIDLPQPPVLLEFLATLWENMEEAYVENLKDILSLKRMHTTSIVPYKDLVWRNLTKFVDRPDKRQDLLNDFHCAFNEIDEDLRRDSDMKCELHCRVADFRTELWELCDARRHEAEEERIRTVRNQRVLLEAVALVNMYVGILQTEIDRFVDTVQLLQDYYVSMSQKPLQESRFSKILLDCVEMENDLWEMSKSETVRESIEGTAERTASKMKAESAGASFHAARIDRFRAEIESLLSDVSSSFDPNQSDVFNAIRESIRQARDTVDSISSMIMEALKKEGKAVVPKTEIKNRGSERTTDSTFTKLARRSRDIVEEWRYAVLSEISRILQRLEVLSAAAQSDVTFLLDTMRQTFHRVHRYIVDRYKREIESVNVMTNVFCLAVEEAKPIQQELLLDGDQFVVRSNVLMFPDDPQRLAVPIREAPSPLRFRMIQLGRLLEIFRRVAPRGIMNERAMVYVLQDLVSCGEEDCHPPSVPCAWRQLRSPDIENLIERLFGPAEYIEWREFIAYAMDLPVPSHQDILEARAAFRARDPESREVITRDQYRSIPLWFLERIETPSDVERDFHGDYEVRPDEENEHSDHEEATEAMLAEVARSGQDANAFVVSSLKDGLIETSEDNTGSAMLRLTLAKELLGRMYLIDRRTVNYTALLLAFCKDKDPREGLGKAFTLAIGARVCTDVVEGERYVERLVEEKRRAKEMELSRDHLRAEANEIVREIMSYVMDSAAKSVAVLDRRRSRDSVLAAKARVMIQKLDEPGEIDPADLLPPEVIAEHLVMEEPSLVGDDNEYERSLESAASIASEDHKVQGDQQRSEKVVFWLPREVCLTVLSTCLPWHATQPDLFQTSLSLREGIARVYDESKDSELNGEQDVVLAHRLVNHSFIRELLFASNKFVTNDMGALLRDILKGRDDEV